MTALRKPIPIGAAVALPAQGSTEGASAPYSLTVIATEYEPVTYAAWSYVMTEDDLPSLGPNGHGAIFDDAQGKRAEIRKPYQAVIYLDVLLCQGCDQPIHSHCCDNCEVVFIDTPPGAERVEA